MCVLATSAVPLMAVVQAITCNGSSSPNPDITPGSRAPLWERSLRPDMIFGMDGPAGQKSGLSAFGTTVSRLIPVRRPFSVQERRFQIARRTSLRRQDQT